MIATLALFSLFLLYLIPDNQELEYTLSNDDIEYEYTNSDSVVYLLDSNDYVARTFIPGGKGEIQEQAKYLLESLIIDGPKNNSIPNGFRQLIPAGTEIKDLSLENKVLTINFSKELLDINEKYEEKMLESIVYTLTNIEGIDSVVIKVEGEVLKELPNSKKQLPTSLDRSYGINKYYDISSVNNVDSYTIYYVSSYNNNEYYVPVTKYINNADNDKVKIIIDELSSSPIHETNLMSFLSANASLINYEQDGDILKLNFNDAILENKSSNKILEEVIYTISLSVKDNYDVEEVSFLVNDKEIYKNSLKSVE